MNYRIFIGYDHRQNISYNVCQFSLFRRASEPIAITALVYEQVGIKRRGLTPFTYSRFMVPALCDYRGWALFMDADIIAQDDICDLWRYADPSKAVIIAESVKPFERAAVMLFNCGHPDNRTLTPEYIERAENLHTIGWTGAIGTFPERWNHCVGYAAPSDDPALIHYTMGVPAFKKTMDCEHQDKWMAEYKAMLSVSPWEELMGRSIHAVEIDGELQPRYKMNVA